MKLKLIKIINEAAGTKSFFWEPERVVKWTPGQYFYYTLPKLKFNDPRGSTRHFTISASPTEGRLLRLTTRLRKESGYKMTLGSLEVGTEIDGEGPEGTLVFTDSDSENSHIFLTGGIGITPFRTFIKYCLDKGSNTPIHLIYSNSHENEIVFREELQTWSRQSPSFKMAMTLTDQKGISEKWNGEKGRIDQKMIRDLCNQWGLEINKNVFWVVGPPSFVNAMEDTLERTKILSENIKTEKFTGY